MAETYLPRHRREDGAPPSRALALAVFERKVRRDHGDANIRAASEEER